MFCAGAHVPWSARTCQTLQLRCEQHVQPMCLAVPSLRPAAANWRLLDSEKHVGMCLGAALDKELQTLAVTAAPARAWQCACLINLPPPAACYLLCSYCLTPVLCAHRLSLTPS